MINSPVKWIGGKAAAASRIIATFPHQGSYDVYVEPCGGAAHVLLTKPTYQHDEILNDRDAAESPVYSTMNHRHRSIMKYMHASRKI